MAMANEVVAELLRKGGVLVGEWIRMAFANSGVAAGTPKSSQDSPDHPKTEATKEPLPAHIAEPTHKMPMPTSEETTYELKRRLARELYRAELDLVGGLKIAGKPCDCLSEKHSLMLEAAAEELISQDPANGVYQDIIGWIHKNQAKVTPEAIVAGTDTGEYPVMAAQFKKFRKDVLGTTSTAVVAKQQQTITLDQARKIAAAEAVAEVERQWSSQKKP
jgi:hypothetical protein